MICYVWLISLGGLPFLKGNRRENGGLGGEETVVRMDYRRINVIKILKCSSPQLMDSGGVQVGKESVCFKKMATGRLAMRQ